MGKSILVAGAIGAAALFLLGNIYSSVAQSAFPSNPMLGTAVTGFLFGATIQVGVRILGVS